MSTVATPMPTTTRALQRLHERHDKVRHMLRALRRRADEDLIAGVEVPSELRAAISRLEAERISVEQRIDDLFL